MFVKFATIGSNFTSVCIRIEFQKSNGAVLVKSNVWTCINLMLTPEYCGHSFHKAASGWYLKLCAQEQHCKQVWYTQYTHVDKQHNICD